MSKNQIDWLSLIDYVFKRKELRYNHQQNKNWFDVVRQERGVITSRQYAAILDNHFTTDQPGQWLKVVQAMGWCDDRTVVLSVVILALQSAYLPQI